LEWLKNPYPGCATIVNIAYICDMIYDDTTKDKFS